MDINLATVQPILETAVKTELKTCYGKMSAELYYNKEGDKLYKFNLSLSDLSEDIAQELLRVNTPFFENPQSPQISLFAED